jgi:serine/threonine-protein kinase
MLRAQTVGRYSIYERIASGGMATVHLGRSAGAAGFARTVAIKRLHPHLVEQPEFSATLVDEARLAARIHHPNVVPVLDVVSSGGELLVVMEYVRGESLAQLLRIESEHNGRVPPRIASAIAIGALHGLHAAHEAMSERGTPLRIVHRDVSPANILVDVDGVPRVIDFGIAKASDRLQTTTAGSIKGKGAYMAPEQAVGGEVSPLSDIYAMSVVLWEMLTCRRLFEAQSNLARAAKGGAATPPSAHAPDVTPELDAIVGKGLSVDAAGRFSSAMEMADALQRAVPPAFSTEVGAWVRTTARTSLAARDAMLAAVEGSVEVSSEADPKVDEAPTVVSPSVPSPASAELTMEEAAVPSQPSSLSVERPRSTSPLAPPPRWGGRILAVAGAAGLVVAGLAVGRVGLRAPGLPPPVSAAQASPLPTSSLPAMSAPLVAEPPAETVELEDPAQAQPARAARPRPAPLRSHHSPERKPPVSGALPARSAPFDPASVR